ncbi:hypothetical protein KFE25_010369 [Diacronema lutheri]|uniref:Uncharacterized protein n=3 Tax=Diacronema lutheri TaxID=2081491 RepID=A0A8J5XL20_DIALT|nr:hypothetical protein KFE25_010369 [Diacronema lutheri]
MDGGRTPLAGAVALAVLAAVLVPRQARPLLRTCGDWCDRAQDEATPCQIDPALTPCAGGAWCETTCGQWALFRLGDPRERKVPCETFARAGAYARGGAPCDPSCLSPEISRERYPAPTGLGFFCDPGTCNPPVQARYENDTRALERGMRILQCPCAWFASDCPEGREDVRAVVKGASAASDGLQVLRLELSAAAFARVIARHKPGGAVRVVHLDAAGDPREQPFALALPASDAAVDGNDARAHAGGTGGAGDGAGDGAGGGVGGGVGGGATGGGGAGGGGHAGSSVEDNGDDEARVAYLELLSGPTRSDGGLHPSVTDVARRLRALPAGRTVMGGLQPADARAPSSSGGESASTSAPPHDAALWVYPTLSGFSNGKYKFLLDALGAGAYSPVAHVFVVATGSGLFGAESAVTSLEALRRAHPPGAAASPRVHVHVLHGVRTMSDVPPEARPIVARWALGGARGGVTLTIVASAVGGGGGGGAWPDATPALAGALRAALDRGAALRARSATTAPAPLGGRASPSAAAPFYVQRALAAIFRTRPRGSLRAAHDDGASDFAHGANESNSAFVGCSRPQVLDQLAVVWKDAVCAGARDVGACAQLAAERVFVNV